ncbi:MAG: minichromosome maintenance protein MCM, partial [Candidatus Aenigmatarchaeota archaeon]
PSIYGYDELKEALVLQLFGGVEKKGIGSERTRGDIHILLIGDPGVAKTKILQSMAEIAPKSIYVSGKSTSGVGLTASAEKDEFGGWTLKAGALVLASGGLASIDEFNLIDKSEQAALHEIMESQSVSVAKAGIVARFKARTSILAAANPKFGRFDPNLLPAEQFDIEPPLLSRFDLIFPIKDVLDEEKDRKLAKHILELHKKAVEEKIREESKKSEEIISIEFLRKYIAYARKTVRPVLTPEAAKILENFYADLRRSGEKQRSVPITPRQLEGLVRLSEASARARLSNRVEVEDAERAIRLQKYVLEQMAFDRSTGYLDIDMLLVGYPKSKQEKYLEVLKIIKDLSSDKEKGVPVSEVVKVAVERQMEEETVRKIIEELLRKGDIYEPKQGYIKYIQRYE